MTLNPGEMTTEEKLKKENRIAQALNKLFERHRIVFWYDAKQELHDDFKELELAGVKKN